MPFSKGTLAFFGVLAVLGAWLLLLGEPVVPVKPATAFHDISAVELARALVEGRQNTAVVDLTPPEEDHHFKNDLKVDGAQPALPQVLRFLGTNRAQHVVIVGREEEAVLRLATVLERRHFTVLLLRGGVDAWQKEVLAPSLAENADDKQRSAHAALVALSDHLQGKSSASGGAPADAPRKVVKVPRAAAAGGGGGC